MYTVKKHEINHRKNRNHLQSLRNLINSMMIQKQLNLLKEKLPKVLDDTERKELKKNNNKTKKKIN